MQRRQDKKPDLILCSDIHLREDTPVCWTGDFDEEQWDSILFVNRLQVKYNCPVICAGDLFHHWKPSPYLLTRAMKYLPKNFFTIYGQHDLPQHNLDLAIKSGINTLAEAGVLKVIPQCHYGQEPRTDLHFGIVSPPKEILVWHHMTYITKPFPGASDGQAEGILRKYSQFDLIVTGDNHQSFYTEYEGRLLVNPGSFTRQSAIQIDFKPRVYLWYAKTNTVEAIYLPIAEGVISREHIEAVEQRDARIDAFISKLGDDWNTTLSFEDNIEAFFNTNVTRKSVKEIIYKALE
jgi:predicted phosphodiesterase